ncbi:MAG: hypothetical protein WC819_01700 [Parcubacteria group bacterium]
MSTGRAFLKVLCPADVTPNMRDIREFLKSKFLDVLDAKDYSPNGWAHRFVVWRYNSKDTIPDEEGIKLVGKDGNIMYFWRCKECSNVVVKCEFPGNHERDSYFGCSCAGTMWGCPIL